MEAILLAIIAAQWAYIAWRDVADRRERGHLLDRIQVGCVVDGVVLEPAAVDEHDEWRIEQRRYTMQRQEEIDDDIPYA